jgi:hypothetical protein
MLIGPASAFVWSWIREPFGGVAEHSSVMNVVLVSSYIRKKEALGLVFRRKTRTGPSKAEATLENGTKGDLAGQPVRLPRWTDPLMQ